MIRCFFDTETNGINDPDLVEVGAVLMEDDRERASLSLIVQPDGWEIPAEVAKIHGIEDAAAHALGVPLVIAIAALTNLWACAEVRVAHNLEFDEKVVRGAITRLGRESTVLWPPAICTKELAAPILNLPPTERMVRAGYGNKPKAPSLAECYRHFFGEDVPGAHGALADARACARVYLKILEGKS